MISELTLTDYHPNQSPEIASQNNPAGGHFSAWRLENFLADLTLMGIYSRKDFFKITLTYGPATYHYADQRFTLEPAQPALVFTNTQVPYTWELSESPCTGFCCVFTENFVPAHTHTPPAAWPVFAADKASFFYLTSEQATSFTRLFEKMLAEQDSSYTYKYELLYHYLMECIHEALKLQPLTSLPEISASNRLVDLFKALLARQYPIVSPARRLELRTPQAFADALAVHVNYLNRTLKSVTGKTTSQWLAERLLQEARTLLLHTDWPINHIAHSLGFEEPTHFTQFFRKHTRATPSAFRQV